MHNPDIKGNTTLKNSIIKTLLYFDIFNYPLHTEEVFRFLGTNSVTKEDVHDSLLDLVDQKQVFQFDDLFTVQQNRQHITRRLIGNKKAQSLQSLVRRRTKLIAGFPFVRGVFASGSYSKGYMDETSDLDFFIITQPGRLWIARTFIVLYKRLFFFNSHKYFCCNYFIDSDHLEIDEKNLFTATELATLIPLYGSNLYLQLIGANTWMMDFFPNHKRKHLHDMTPEKNRFIKLFAERIMSGKPGDALEEYLMSVTLKRWKRLYEKKYSIHDFEIAFKTRKHVSKNHPNHFQKKVIECYEEKLNSFNRQHKVSIE